MTMTLHKPPLPEEPTTPAAVALLRQVSLKLGNIQILDNVDLTIAKGETLGIIGGNGTGKSTILKLLTGLLRPDTGTLTVFDRAPTGPDVLHRIGAAIDSPALYPWMSGKAALRTVLDLRGQPDNGQVQQALERFGLGDTGRKRVVKYSQGMKKRLALAAASLDDPELVLLDEPTNALDPQARDIVDTWMQSLRTNGTTTVLVTHRTSEAQQCDRLIKITRLRTLEPATVEDLRAED